MSQKSTVRSRLASPARVGRGRTWPEGGGRAGAARATAVPELLPIRSEPVPERGPRVAKPPSWVKEPLLMVAAAAREPPERVIVPEELADWAMTRVPATV